MAGYTVPGITRKHVFVEDDNDLASLADMEAGFSGNHPLFMKSSFFNASRRSSSYRVLSSSTASMRSARFYNAGCEERHQPHFLEACFLCKKPLGDNRDIFMYRGDTPFCSEECRQQQIDIDEEKEKKWNHSASASMKALRKDQRNSSPNKTQNYPVRTSTIAAA